MKVLVVDHDFSRRHATVADLGQYLLTEEVVILTASGNEDALRIFWREHPDVLMVGIGETMPTVSGGDGTAINGKELIAKVRETEGNRHTGIIIVDGSAKDDSALSVECLELGADDFLRRGCTPAEMVARLRAVLRLKTMTDELRSANHKLRQLSLTDELTGLANMRRFNQRFGELLRRCRRGQAGLGVLMLDLDHFKSINDSSNHLVGSYVISEAGRVIYTVGRGGQAGVAARYGGDEFIIAVEAPCIGDVNALGERIREAIAATSFEKDGRIFRITTSIGIAWVAPGFKGRADDLVREADLMLYRSKHEGRNRVTGTTLNDPLAVTDLPFRDATAAADNDGSADELNLSNVLRQRR